MKLETRNLRTNIQEQLSEGRCPFEIASNFFISLKVTEKIIKKIKHSESKSSKITAPLSTY